MRLVADSGYEPAAISSKQLVSSNYARVNTRSLVFDTHYVRNVLKYVTHYVRNRSYVKHSFVLFNDLCFKQRDR